VTADYAFVSPVQAPHNVSCPNGGQGIGCVRAPLGTTDYSSFLLQAQASGAQVSGLRTRERIFPTRSGGQRIRHHKTMSRRRCSPSSFDYQLPLQTASGLYLPPRLVLGLNRGDRAFAKRF